MAISKEKIIQDVLLGFGEPAFSFIPNVSPWYSEEGLLKIGVGSLYDKTRAKELMKEAGYGIDKNGNFQIVDKRGDKIKLKFFTITGSKVHESMAYLIQKELSDIGIEVDIKFVPWEIMLRKYYMNKVPGSDQPGRNNNGPRAVSEEPWDLIYAGQSTDPLQPSGTEIFFVTDGGLNTYGYSNPEVDALFKKVRSKESLDITARKKIYAELSKLISEEQPLDFLAYAKTNAAYKSNVQGIDPGISMTYNYQEWYFG
jgi:peptide/nickel transport system substrate-binding protein